ncbi:MAG: CAP domain-containing protein, partial [Minisyncoccia bacterium]
MKGISKWFRKYFIPHEHNDYKPHFLRHESAVFMLLIILVVELGFLAQVFIIFDKTNFLASVLPGVLTTLTNEERAQNAVAPLTQNNLLTEAAQLKANDMATNGYFAHTSPDGKTPWYWLDQVGYHYQEAGENLAINFFESSDVAQAWMNSPTHRENIVKPDYKEIGIAVASGTYQGHNTVFVVQFFGTPFAFAEAPTGTAPTQTTPVKIAQTTPAPKPKPVPTPIPTPVTTPVVATAPSAPVTPVQVLGQESTSSTSASAGQQDLFSNIKSFMERALTSPNKAVNYVYGGIIILIILSLLLILFIRSERAHPLLVMRGAALVAIIFLLVFINTRVFRVQTEL